MSITTCRECNKEVSTDARACPHCGARYPARKEWKGSGIDWRSKTSFYGYPVVHVAFGRDAQGKLRIAKGIIAIGQFAIGVITIAQFGIGVLFGFGQFIFGLTAVAQFAVTVVFGIGQIATGYIAIGQFALGYYALAQAGLAKYLWSVGRKDIEAMEFFRQLAEKIMGK
ncbi:MAG: zinc ribbon domain-containing protein [candidate division KSB1 bacterium]|nr:zinc ribbon domain-containing protein [candidate division KSB1 bacterium]